MFLNIQLKLLLKIIFIRSHNDHHHITLPWVHKINE
jgi:hypothetical protein